MPTTTVTKTTYTDSEGKQREQYRTTVPKGIAEGLDLDGAKVEWEIKSGDAVRVSVEERGGENE